MQPIGREELSAQGSIRRRGPWGWPAAVTFLVAATALAEALPNSDDAATGLYLLAVLATALVAGPLPAAVTALAACLGSWWFFTPIMRSFELEDATDLTGPAVVLVAGVLITGAAYAVQRARWRAEEQARQLGTLNRLAVALGELEVGGEREVDVIVGAALERAEGHVDNAAVEALRTSAVERLELRAAERRAQAADVFLAEVTKVLSGALDSGAVIDEVRKLVVPQLADVCTVELEELDPGEATSAELRIPLRSRQRVIATLVCTRHDGLFDDVDRRLAEELAGRAAQSLDAALAYEEQARSSTTLQRSLLPQGLVSVPNLAVAARYVAASVGHEVGGDFYDVIATPTGGVVLIIGDVQGKGVEAATVTAVARHTLRSAALAGDAPTTMLSRLNRALLYAQEEAAEGGADDDPRFVTAAVVHLEPTPTGFRATAASGGHPPPLLIRAAGSVEALMAHGIVLGVIDDPAFGEITADISLADTVVLYTDGATEQSHRGDFDEQELGRLIRHRLAPANAEAVAQLILDTVLQMAPGQPRDDLAVVVACATGPR